MQSSEDIDYQPVTISCSDHTQAYVTPILLEMNIYSRREVGFNAYAYFRQVCKKYTSLFSANLDVAVSRLACQSVLNIYATHSVCSVL